MTLPNGQMPPTPVPVPGQELVQPVPSTVRVWTIPGPKEAIVAVLIATPLGGMHFFWTPDEAIEIAGQLRHHGRVGKSGLTLPPGVRLGGDDDTAAPDTQRNEVELALPPHDLDAAREIGERQAADLLAEQRRAGGPEITETQ